MITTFHLIVNSDAIRNDEDALDVFIEHANKTISIYVDYGFDYEFLGYSADGYAFDVHLDTERVEDAYTIMWDKFEDDVIDTINISYEEA